MERCRDRHCGRGAAALLFGLRRPGAVPPVYLAPEDSARQRACGGPFFATKPDKGRTGMEGAGESRRGYRATSVGGTPIKTPAPSGLQSNQGAAVTQRGPPVR